MRVSIRDAEGGMCSMYNIPRAVFRGGPGRSGSIAMALKRQIAMYLARTEGGHSFPVIGNYFDRDHTTALHACTLVSQKIAENADFAREVEGCRVMVRKYAAQRIERERHWARQLQEGKVSWEVEPVSPLLRQRA